MIDQDFLDKWVKIIVPEEYGPDKNPHNGKPILEICILSPDKMEENKENYFNVCNPDTRLLGETIDMGALFALIGKEKDYLTNKYVIFLNSSQSETMAVYTLAHEVGHVCGFLTDSSVHNLDPDSFANLYAFNRISEVIKDSLLKMKILTTAFSEKTGK